MCIKRSFLIAIVDDDASVLDAIGNLMESVGYAVIRFNSAHAFLSGASLNMVDCVISDIGMPVMTGIELQTQLGRLDPKVPVILMTGRSDSDAAAAGARNNWGFFRKPFAAQLLLDALQLALASRKPTYGQPAAME